MLGAKKYQNRPMLHEVIQKSTFLLRHGVFGIATLSLLLNAFIPNTFVMNKDAYINMRIHESNYVGQYFCLSLCER